MQKQPNALLEKFQHYKIGIPSIDDAHLEILTTIDAGRHITDVLELRTVLERLEGLWAAHICLEEALMLETNFPFMLHHLNAHNVVTSRIGEIRSSFDKSPAPILVPAYNPLAEFQHLIMDHLDHFDRQLIGTVAFNSGLD